MKVLICYFSGTGHTRKVVEKYAQCFSQQHQCELVAIENTFETKRALSQDILNKIGDADLIGIAYPVHAFNAPSIVLSFAKLLPKHANAKRVFIMSTSGEPLKLNNISSIKLRRLLKRRNFTVTNEYHYCMPYNIMFRHSDDMAYKMWTMAQKIVPLDVNEILQGTSRRLENVFCGRLIAWIMRCEHWGGRLNGRMYKVADNCVHCEKCVNDCPTHNIKIVNGKFKFGKNCLMCMRCAHLCPKSALKIGWFNKWKVNGAYKFAEPATDEQQHYNKMLTKAYAKYFTECEQRLAETE